MNRPLPYKDRKSQSGLTLIDMAIVLTVAGIMAIPLLHTYDAWKKGKSTTTTDSNIELVNAAIEEFYFENGRYPCPAVLTTGPEDADYGMEACDNPDVDPTPGVNVGILNGGVPFATLKITPLEATDGWQHKLRYTVTEEQARNTVTPMTLPGTLSVSGYTQVTNPDTGEIVCDPTWAERTGAAHYVLISAGEDAVGAYTLQGVNVEPCGENRDAQNRNCDNDREFVWDVCIKSGGIGPRSPGGTLMRSAGKYDDMFYYQPQTPIRMWFYDFDNNQNVVSDVSNGFIGINNPDPQTQIDVVGNIRTMQNPADPAGKPGNVNAQTFCNDGGGDCFAAADIGGSNPDMNCETSGQNRGMTGVARSRVACGPTFPATAAGSCNPGEYVVGINAEGRLVCAPIPE